MNKILVCTHGDFYLCNSMQKIHNDEGDEMYRLEGDHFTEFIFPYEFESVSTDYDSDDWQITQL